MLMSTFKGTKLGKAAVTVAALLISPVAFHAQYRSTLFDRIERTIAQNNTEWIFVNKSQNPNPQYRVCIWVLREKKIPYREIIVWMVEERDAKEAARTFYRRVPSTVGQPFQQLQIGDKCYISSTSGIGVSLLLRKANLVVNVVAHEHIPGSVVPSDVVFRFAQQIASVVPSAPMKARSSLEENKKEAQLHLEKGETALKEHRYQEAIEEFKKAIELDGDSAEAHYALGLAHLKAGDKVKASEAFKEAIRLRAGGAT